MAVTSHTARNVVNMEVFFSLSYESRSNFHGRFIVSQGRMDICQLNACFVIVRACMQAHDVDLERSDLRIYNWFNDDSDTLNERRMTS